MDNQQPPPQLLQEATRLKAYFPFRVIWCAVDPKTDGTQSGANTTKRQANKLARQGWTVWTV